ncbi:branched-chain amino acid ABC transporter permease [Pseudomonas sp. CCM 7891]|uniref:Branched-chain amino acid ABC transporter permease n=1 Tax=Pseudomonas karstica TaxID=1055468 RepID=A0A7X2UYA5_9PSED|nr:AzlC family ABC transporter permease [Pseudomonas karstica]MTD19303.1 branched-chain amino acid ABC transporter permease [Pseudomonas karstica]
MASIEVGKSELGLREICYGFQQLLPISLFVVAFGLAFGLASTQMGLTNSTTMAMSIFVFAGAAQFAVLDLWGQHIPVLPLAVTVFAINARHLLMGAALYPWLKHLPAAKRYGIMLVVSDSNWAMSMQALSRSQPGLGLLFGGGLALWAAWILGTWLGIHFGNVINSPISLGLDMVMGCFLWAMVLGGNKSTRLIFIWAVAGCAALLARAYLPENAHVVTGALAGGLLGAMWTEQKQ